MPNNYRLISLRIALFAILFGMAHSAWPDSVGQIQTTKFFTPETVAQFTQRLQTSEPSIKVGDTLSYIIQFTPVANGAVFGAGGYITDYIPVGTEVVGASYVQPSGSSFVDVPPPQASTMPDGWGNRGAANYTSAPFVGTGTGRLSELYADTGIFYSTDPRTALYNAPSTDGRIRQGGSSCGGNGYSIAPTAQGQLNPIIGQTCASTHNLWDASSTNAFGTNAALPVGAAPQPVLAGSNGTGAGPFNAASAVAGPDTGYQLDYTGSVGPWQRIYYPGSMIGTNANGPATAFGALVIAGTPTGLGWNLSPSNPLPANTNAVRWAAGRLSVGTLSYVKISLRVNSLPSTSAGLINASEVFGGDASADDPGRGKDFVWRYHVPSVAESISSLMVVKTVVGECSSTDLATATACVPIASDGATVPAQYVKLRYRITYLNSSNSTQTNVQLRDILPFKTDVQTVRAGNIYIVSGPDIRTNTLTPGAPSTISTNGAAVGGTRADVAPTTIGTPTSQQTLNFAPIVSLIPGAGGSLEVDVVVGRSATQTLSNLTVVGNRANITSTQISAPGANSTATSAVGNVAQLSVDKTTTTPTLAPNGTATYKITVTNTGSAPATAVTVNDFLPSTGSGPSDATKRFNYVSTTSIKINGVTQAAITPTFVTPATVAPYNGLNRQQVIWTTGYTIPAGQTMEIIFTATVGSAVPALTTPYTNDIRGSFNGGVFNPTTVNGVSLAPITITSPLQITKTIDCVYNTALTACEAYDGNGIVPSNAKVRYKLHYANNSGSAHTNVLLCDRLSSTQTTPALTATFSTPTVPPTPSGSYTNTSPPDGPPSATLTIPATGACGFTGGSSFNYPAIPSLAAGASGDVYFDATTNAANTKILSNIGKIVSTESPGGSSSTVDAGIRDNANLVVTKTTSTPTIGVNGLASYTITVTNTGNLPANTIKIYDELPFLTAPAGATGRFSHSATSSITGMTAVTPTTASPPTQAGYTGNTNQQEVLWDFGAQTLAPDDSFTINFTAQAGSAIPSGSTTYLNNVTASYKSGTNTLYTGVSNTAVVTIPTNLSITKTIDCVYNSSFTSCIPSDNGIIPVNGKVRYKIHYANTSTTTAQTNVYICDRITSTQTSPVFAATISQPTLAPPHDDAPAIGVPAQIAAATATATACGYSGANTFAYPVIGSLAAGASGDVYFDLNTNAASLANITNTGKIVSSQSPVGETSAAAAAALNVPVLDVSKTTSTPSSSADDVVTYTITVTNTGNATTSGLRVYDFLPYSGSVLNTSKQFTYLNTVSYAKNGSPFTPAVTVTTAGPPTLPPYNGNANQRQVKWDFGTAGANQLAFGDTLTITFRATVGSAVPVGNYGNSLLADFDSAAGGGINAINNTAIVNISLVPQNFDYSDAPASFGNATHTVPGTPTIYLGSTKPDADSISNRNTWQSQTTANGDDTDGTSDENLAQLLGSNINSFPPLAITSTSYTLTLNCTGTGTVSGWIDFNKNGAFDTDERAQNTCTSGKSALNWTGLTGLTQGLTYARFRIASSASESGSATGSAVDGEVEDYPITIGASAATITGTVFNDSGSGGGTANDGIRNGEETGIVGVTVKLTNCSTTTYGTATTNATGGYSLPTVGVPAGPVCVEQTNLSGYTSTGANVAGSLTPAGYTLTSADKISFTLATNTSYTGLNFGDVSANQFLTDGTKTGIGGSTVLYQHTFIAGAGGAVTFSLPGATSSPALSSWNETLYTDTNCNGSIDSGESLTSTSAIPVAVGDEICLILKEFIPSGAPMGATNLVPVRASFVYTGSSAPPTLYTRQDLTTVSSSAVELIKRVRNVTLDGAGLPNWQVSNAAKAGETLEYQITYTNNGSSPINALVVNDTTPAYTTFVSASAGTLPPNLLTCTKTTPSATAVPCAATDTPGGTGGIEWKFTGPLAPSASGAVTFRVTLD